MYANISCYVFPYVPVLHSNPVHPKSQVHVSGAVQDPPFRQGLVHIAKTRKLRGLESFMLKLLEHQSFTQHSIQHTLALRHTPTPLSIRLAGSTV